MAFFKSWLTFVLGLEAYRIGNHGSKYCLQIDPIHEFVLSSRHVDRPS